MLLLVSDLLLILAYQVLALFRFLLVLCGCKCRGFWVQIVLSVRMPTLLLDVRLPGLIERIRRIGRLLCQFQLLLVHSLSSSLRGLLMVVLGPLAILILRLTLIKLI